MSNGIVTFKKCYDPIAFGDVKKLILKKFQEKYPSLKIKQISLSSTSPINFDLSGYKVKDIDLRENNYRNSQGVLSVIYRKKFKLKRIYLRYEILGTILVFKAKYNLRNGKILKNNDYVTTKIKFDVLPLNVLTADLNKKYIIRGYIRKGTILTSNDIRVKKSVLKNDSIQAILKDENLIIEEEAHVLSDANIGDVVKIRTLKGKILKAKILSPKSAIIIE
ncbi:MAG: flagellar basal body P-ring formation chaperone FlgA [Sulfurospirillaceae bacterium]|nr:flagellar basal body P-ring formation chaperone FlgA [Sulfurospirillaceae bacterium]